MDPETYRNQRRLIEQMKRRLIEHQHPHDPERPEYTWEDIEEMERNLEEVV